MPARTAGSAVWPDISSNLSPKAQGGEPCAHVFRQGKQDAYRHQGEITIWPGFTSRKVEVCWLRRDPAMPTIGKKHPDPANAPNAEAARRSAQEFWEEPWAFSQCIPRTFRGQRSARRNARSADPSSARCIGYAGLALADANALAPPGRDRFVVDSALEEDGFELAVPPRKEGLREDTSETMTVST
jgi:hypothetical protein